MSLFTETEAGMSGGLAPEGALRGFSNFANRLVSCSPPPELGGGGGRVEGEGVGGALVEAGGCECEGGGSEGVGAETVEMVGGGGGAPGRPPGGEEERQGSYLTP